VRRAEKRDHAAVRALYGTLQNAHAFKLPQIFSPAVADDLAAEDFAASIEAKDRVVLVVERDREIVAAAQANLLDYAGDGTFVTRRRVYVTHLITERSARRQGHGRALMQAVTAWARLHDADSIELCVWEGSEEATAFYRALGYRPISSQFARMLTDPDGKKEE
jgi:ribosomal protein S18 acetylase RimI-like enzyme